MSESFSIKSVRSDAELVFVDREGEYFTIAIHGSEASCTRRVWGYTDCDFLVDMFSHLAQQSTCPIAPVDWESIERELSLKCHVDKLGHVFIEVEVIQSEGSENWRFNRIIETEFGQLQRIANEIRIFFEN